MNTAINQYLTQIKTHLNIDVAKEHTHRAALANLLETLSPSIHAVNEPKCIECGSPDLVILSQADNVPLGYIEAKDINSSLDKALQSEQLERYLESLHNLILTDYLEFRWFVEGKYQSQMTVRLAEVNQDRTLKPLPAAFEAFVQQLDTFVHTPVRTIGSPEKLAAKMAKIAGLIRDSIIKASQQEKTGALHHQFDSFRKVLMNRFTAEEFADMYAQTVCYGLFAAKCSAPSGQPFSRIHAGHYLPKTNPFLRNLFSQIVGEELDERLVWAVEHLVTVLNNTDIAAILADFGRRTWQKDPVLHFYETFLKHYDPNICEMRGIYYTPEPVVSYIVRSVDILLKQRFKLRNGFADSSRLESGQHQVQILDPAVGTGTFLYAVFKHIFAKFQNNNKKMWSTYVNEHLLPRVHGFELLMAPYIVAHIKLGLQLQEMGYQFDSDERLQIFLTNSLEDAFEKGTAPTLPVMDWLINEGQAASRVKQESPVMVIVGNPHSSGHSANIGEWITHLLKGIDERHRGTKTANYFQVDDKPLKERNLKGLQDDYVKFIRFAQRRIEQTGYGILGFVTNNAYLDNLTFRGMRQHLLADFDEIYVLDLHGRYQKKKKSPKRGVDQNVFDIKQGVAIGIFVKYRKSAEKQATVFHAELWGKRYKKYAWLEKQDVKTIDWKELKPTSPFYFFVPKDVRLREEYEQYWKVPSMMPVNSSGIMTARDDLTIQETPQAVIDTVTDFVALEPEMAREKYQLGEDSKDWKVHLAQQDIRNNQVEDSDIIPILYRPFDMKYTYYTGKTQGFICRPRYKVMQHILAGENVGLFFSKKASTTNPFNHIFCSDYPIVARIFPDNSCIAYFSPLYLYPTEQNDFLDYSTTKRKSNLAPNFIKEVEDRLKLQFIDDDTGDLTTTIGPKDIFHYMYAIFHSPTYRQRYREFLQIDFPRLPLTSDKTLFQQLAQLGKQLVTIHLMEAEIDSDSRYPIEGDNRVEKITYENNTVYINQTQYFNNVKQNVWQFRIGRYRVAKKWLVDRTGRQLSYEDCNHYLYILAALKQTIQLMAKINAAIPEFPLP